MTWALRVIIGAGALLGIIALQLGVLAMLGLLDEAEPWYVVDAPTVVRVFIEERGAEMSEEEMAAAILIFDQLVMEEAEAVYAATGARLVNSSHVLAGAEDVSVPFAARVVARWDAAHGSSGSGEAGQ